MDKKKRIVVTGMGLVSCFGSDLDHFYQCLLEGKSGIRPIDRFPVEEYPTRFAGTVTGLNVEDYMEKKQARRVDPYVQYTMVAGKRALEHAGLKGEALDKLKKNKCGILIGSGMGGMSVYCDGVQTVLEKGFKRLTPFFVPYIITNMGGALLGIDTGFMGPNYSVSTACATANYSIYLAAEHIRKGVADLMVCGGAEAAVIPVGLAGFVAIKALSTRNDAPEKASRPWDKNRDGFVMGEGAGVLVLESLEHALARGAPILAEYLGGAISCDAYHMTDPPQDGRGVCLSIEEALKDAGIPKERVNYINAHATSTLAGDTAEAAAIKEAFKEHAPKIKINATKSMTGHCLGAAAGIEAVATIKAIQTGKLHPTINLEDPEECVQDLDIVRQAQDHKIDVALSNSFGFGGHNSSILFAPYRP
ncbi:MAG: beta-ketoacyl-ACP synthase II [Verrucomicrobia bacterium]|nr:beta-ketoacyl-ACP synthase II [Verrucomicrobiota bacterium]